MNYVTNERWLRKEVKELLGLRKFSNNMIVKAADSKDVEITKLSQLVNGKEEQHNIKKGFERLKSQLTSYNSESGHKKEDFDEEGMKRNMVLSLFKEANNSETKSIHSSIDQKNYSRKTHGVDSKEDLIDLKNELSFSRSLSVQSNRGNALFYFLYILINSFKT
jgi:hypothetical protein